MSQPESPCFGCPDRIVGCHTVCEKYIAYDNECKVLRDERLKVAEHNYTMKAIEKRRIKMASEGRFYRQRYYDRNKK